MQFFINTSRTVQFPIQKYVKDLRAKISRQTCSLSVLLVSDRYILLSHGRKFFKTLDRNIVSCSFHFSSDLNNPYRVNKVIDVTIPLQCQVKDSKLFLTEGCKVCVRGIDILWKNFLYVQYVLLLYMGRILKFLMKSYWLSCNYTQWLKSPPNL